MESMERMDAGEALKIYFGYDSYKPGQEEVIDALTDGQDVLAIMPTGAGKSVCYQVPALLMPGITVVISPLISLMQDQVKALNAAGIHAGYINSSLTESQISRVYANAAEGTYKILYVAPERLESPEFVDFTERVVISMVTVDEAHCISQWGQDFRPAYLKIVDFIDRLSRRPVVSAFTATATEEVKQDISCVLKLRNPRMVSTGFDRENLFFDVVTSGKKDDYVLKYIREHPGESGIIYCATRKNTDTLHALLCGAGVPAARYHAGMSNEDRKASQDDFIYDRLPVIVATNAFGMGIDKSNVRYVIHYNMPQSMENYYQEAGRAGRDGEPAQCILLFSAQDIVINRFLLEHKDFADVPYEDIEPIRRRDARRLKIMEGYCRTSGCLRSCILGYFGEERRKPCGNCGNCLREYTETDMIEEAKQVVNCVWEARGRYGMSVILGTLIGADRARLKELGTTGYRSYGALKNHTEYELRLLIGQMIADGYLYQTEDMYSVIRLGNIEPLKEPGARVPVRIYREKDPENRAAPGRRKSTDRLTKAGFTLFDELRKLRLAIAGEEGIPPYIVAGDRTLIDMSAKAPRDSEAMLKVSGVGRARCEKYGARFLEVINAFLDSHPGCVTGMDPETETETGTGTGTGAAEAEDGAAAEAAEKSSRRKKQKVPFYLNPEDAEKFEYGDEYSLSEIRDELNRITSAENVKHIFGTDIFRFLARMGYAEERESDGYMVRMPTQEGLSRGIATVEKVSKTGHVYTDLTLRREIQREIVEHFTGIRDQEETPADSGA